MTRVGCHKMILLKYVYHTVNLESTRIRLQPITRSILSSPFRSRRHNNAHSKLISTMLQNHNGASAVERQNDYQRKFPAFVWDGQRSCASQAQYMKSKYFMQFRLIRSLEHFCHGTQQYLTKQWLKWYVYCCIYDGLGLPLYCLIIHKPVLTGL